MSEPLRTLASPVLAPLVPALFDRPRPTESKATCDNCAMCARADQPKVTGIEFFEPDLKCCTYYPHLPNFLVGAILSSSTPELAVGRERMLAKTKEKYGVTPAFLAPSRMYSVFHAASRGSAYGRSKTLLCPYFDDGKCSIWSHRNGTCATFFCKHERGGTARRFWMAFEQLLSFIEARVAGWAMKRVDATLEEPQVPKGQLTVDDLDEVPPSDYERFWGKWVGKEAEFYKACFRETKHLERKDIEAMLAEPEGQKLVAALEKNHDAVTNPRLEPRLVLSSSLRKESLPTGVAIASYSPLDVQFFEEGLYEVLEKLKPDETVDDFRARMEKEEEIEVAPELLLYLQLFEILVPPKGTDIAEDAAPAAPEVPQADPLQQQEVAS